MQTDAPRVETLITINGRTFQSIDKAQLSSLIDFFAEEVLGRDSQGRELPVSIGVAAELKVQFESVKDDLGRRLLALVSQDFAAEYHVALPSETTLYDEAGSIIDEAESRLLSDGVKQDLYDLVARTLKRCGHTPLALVVPEDRLLTPIETLDLWVWKHLGKAPSSIDESVARWQAHHNFLVAHLFRVWQVIVDVDLVEPVTAVEHAALRPLPPTTPKVKISFLSVDIPQTRQATQTSTDSPDSGDKPTPAGKRGISSSSHGEPRPRLSSQRVGYLAPEKRTKTSVILDLTESRIAGDRRTAKITPGQNALRFALSQNGHVERTKKTVAYDFDVDTGVHLFAGRSSIAIRVTDHDGEQYQPATFGNAERNRAQASDALIIPVAVEGVAEDDAVAGVKDALFLARQISQHRFRRNLPIALVIPASDKILSEKEVAAIPKSRAIPANVQRDLLTIPNGYAVGRLVGDPVSRMRHAVVQNPGIASSLNTLRVMERFFARYEPLLREAISVSRNVELFFTMTSTKASGWSRTYGSVELIEWLGEQLANQIRPTLPALVSQERTVLTARQMRVQTLSERVQRLETRRNALRVRKEANTTALYVLPWNKPERLDAKDKQAEASLIALLTEIESALGMKPGANAANAIAARQAGIELASAELAARVRTLEGVC